MFRRLLRQISLRVPRSLKDRIPLRIKEVLRQQYLPRTIVIDIVGSCNLACPSCPSGGQNKNRGGRMSLELFHRILAKIARENPGTTVSLFNWTEPLLHPQVPEFIEAVRAFGLKSRISTHLNTLQDPRRLAQSNPDAITISLSGFTQEIYAVGHADGDIETVKENMCRLSDALREAGATSEVTVYYHKYLHNLSEVDKMSEYAKSLSFKFGASWAYYMPVERVQDYIEGRLPESDIAFVEERFALNIRRSVAATEPYRTEPCAFPSTLLTLDCRGDVQLCCAVYDAQRFTIGSYLDTPLEVIEKKLQSHPYCQECARHGLHVYASWHGHPINAEYEKIATEECERKAVLPHLVKIEPVLRQR